MSKITIGRLAQATGTKVETVRYYERIGLLGAPARSEGNYRVYGMTELGRLSFVRRARDLGFSIEQVRDLLAMSDDRARPCSAVDELARQHLRSIDGKIADLKALKKELGNVVRQCGLGTVAECLIIEALAPGRLDA